MFLLFLTCLLCSQALRLEAQTTCSPEQYYNTDYDECHRCSKGHYCGDGLKEFSCDPGTHNNIYSQVKYRKCLQNHQKIYDEPLLYKRVPTGQYSTNVSIFPLQCPPEHKGIIVQIKQLLRYHVPLMNTMIYFNR